MAELTFVGAAGTVTGSKHLVSLGDKHFYVDCGLFQGAADVRSLNDAPLPLPASDVNAVVITHGHIDHVGYLPKLVKDGFKGPIFCTPPTKALMEIVLADAAHLQGMLWHRGLQHERPHAPPPYYAQDDVDQTLRQVQTVPLHQAFDVAGIAKATYSNAAHIIGSAFATIDIDGRRALFSGDMGRYNRPLLYDPDPIGAGVDLLVCESTYGGAVHPPQPLEALRDALVAGMARGGAIVIPAFAVERTQDILLAIGQIQQMEPKIANLPIHLDSPMAEKVDVLFKDFPDAHRPIPITVGAPFGCKNLTLHVTTEDSKRLNFVKGPHVIISASGMAAGGRVLHHLHNHLSDKESTIVFVGYQALGTLGYLLLHGAHTIKLLGDSLPVRAALVSLQGYSAHADKNDFKRWFDTCAGKPHLYAVHGEAESAAALATLAESGYGWSATVAKRGTTVTI